MNELFFEKILPSQGVLCVASISKTGQISPRFPETVDELLAQISSFLTKEVNIYFTPGSYEGSRRTQKDCVAVRSFFLDLDYMHGKSVYISKEAAIADTERFCAEIDWPAPTLVDSGGGIHAYWIFDEDLPSKEWTAYAERFKSLCLEHGMIIDECVPADSARLMRVPGTLNYRYDPPSPSLLLTEVFTSPIERLLGALGEPEESPISDLSQIFASAEQGVDEETRRIWDEQRKNFEFSFYSIVEKSLEDVGCNQIKDAVINAATLPEPQWYAAMSVAVRCTEGMEAVHKLSEDYPGYSPTDTERKANQSLENATGAHSCEAFESLNPAGCKGCPHRMKFGKMGPISLGKTLRIAVAIEVPEVDETEAGEVRDPEIPTGVPHSLVFPDYLLPYARGQNGGIYYIPPKRTTKDGKVIQDDPELLMQHDLYPTQRMFSPYDGECLMMRLVLPRDAIRNFMLPLKDVAAYEKLKAALASNGVVFEPAKINRLASYIMKWSSFLINTEKAEVMHMQQGWTEGHQSFVLGANEYSNGKCHASPPSPMSRNITKYLTVKGTYERWQQSAQALNAPEFELHALVLLAGFASPLIEFTSVNGIIFSVLGATGCAKTGALYGALSIWGEPAPLALNDATDNSLIQRMVSLKNLPLGLDEQSNMAPKTASDLAYKVSAGRSKLRMQASTNSERNQEYLTHLICIATLNQSIKDKVQQFKSDASAEDMRIFEVYVDKPSTLTEALGKEVFDAFNFNHGHAGPIYVQKLMELGPQKVSDIISEEYDKVMARFTGKSEFRFLIWFGAVIFAAERFCRMAGIVDYEMTRIGNVLLKNLNTISDNREKNKMDPTVLLGEFMDKHIRDTLVIQDGRVTHEPFGNLLVRVEVETDESEKICNAFVSSSALKTFLSDKQISIHAFEDDMKRRGILSALAGRDRIKKKMAGGWKAGLSSTNIHAYVFKMNAEDFIGTINEPTAIAA